MFQIGLATSHDPWGHSENDNFLHAGAATQRRGAEDAEITQRILQLILRQSFLVEVVSTHQHGSTPNAWGIQEEHEQSRYSAASLMIEKISFSTSSATGFNSGALKSSNIMVGFMVTSFTFSPS